MKLYNVPDGSTIKVTGEIATPPAAPEIKEGQILYFHHIDGMYSYCYDLDGNIVHLVAWAEVEIL